MFIIVSPRLLNKKVFPVATTLTLIIPKREFSLLLSLPTVNFPSFITQIENSPSKFAVRWFLLLFTQDLKLQDTIELWFELLKPHGIFDAPTFQEKVIKVCECASIINYKIYLNEKTCSFIETMQNGSNLNFNELKATALSIKISQ